MATAAHATSSPARKVQGPQHYTGLSTDRRPRPWADTDQLVGPGSTFTATDTGDVDVWNGSRWLAASKPNEQARLLAALLHEQRRANDLLEVIVAQLA